MEVGQSLLPYDVQQASTGKLFPIKFHKSISSKKYHLFLS